MKRSVFFGTLICALLAMFASCSNPAVSTEAINLGTYSAGWYLPTLAELFAIWKVKATVDAASALCGGSKFSTSWYWSSSQCATYDNDATYDKDAYYLYFSKGFLDATTKDVSNCRVCAIRSFN